MAVIFLKLAKYRFNMDVQVPFYEFITVYVDVFRNLKLPIITQVAVIMHRSSIVDY